MLIVLLQIYFMNYFCIEAFMELNLERRQQQMKYSQKEGLNRWQYHFLLDQYDNSYHSITRIQQSRRELGTIPTKNKYTTKRKNYNKVDAITVNPEQIERQISLALESMKGMLLIRSNTDSSSREAGVHSQLLFPTIRECNSAIADFGDIGDLLRALKLFGKMRKATALYQQIKNQQEYQQNYNQKAIMLVPVPIPTIVTYSTLMSRAVNLNKPIVALRLWNLMITSTHDKKNKIIIDVRAANILMNCYAKLADIESAKRLLNEMKIQQLLKLKKTKKLIEEVSSQTKQQNTIKSSTYFDKIQLPCPNIVTYNTFLNVCQKANDLDSAINAVQDMSLDSTGQNKIQPDERTYTTLIATVARKATLQYGKNDPTLAFTLLRDMIERNIKPNGMTYSALIDVCGRCNRSDLAMTGLRLMLQQKAQEKQQQKANAAAAVGNNNNKNIENGNNKVSNGLETEAANNSNEKNSAEHKYVILPNEVGAWTAAINACGKANRFDTSIRLFYAMYPNFNVQPNTITCGCLTDSLLRGGRIADAVNVLRYMKLHSIPPSEVMYTSLISRASKLVQMENNNKKKKQYHHHHVSYQGKEDATTTESSMQQQDSGIKAIDVYTELIKSLSNIQWSSTSRKSNSKTKEQLMSQKRYQASLSSFLQGGQEETLLRTFLVFQEMKNVGATPDLACFNSLLSACAKAGDIQRAHDILRQMQELYDIDPSDTSWRHMIRAATTAAVSSLKIEIYRKDNNSNDRQVSYEWISNVESIWKQGLSYRRKSSSNQKRNRIVDESYKFVWKPSAESFVTLLSAYIKQAESIRYSHLYHNNAKTSLVVINCYKKVIQLYEDILMGQNNEEMGCDRIDVNILLDHPKGMILILQSIVALDEIIFITRDTYEDNGNLVMTWKDNDNFNNDIDNTDDVLSPWMQQYDLRKMATSIMQLDCLKELNQVPKTNNNNRMERSSSDRVLKIVNSWSIISE